MDVKRIIMEHPGSGFCFFFPAAADVEETAGILEAEIIIAAGLFCFFFSVAEMEILSAAIQSVETAEITAAAD